MLPLALGSLVFVNVAVSAAVWRSGLYERRQCFYQFALIWALPLVGALISVIALRSAKEDSRGHRIVKEPLGEPESFSQRSAVDDD